MSPLIPKWRIRLQGEAADLEDLANGLRGKTRITRENREYFLESEFFDGLSQPDDVRVKGTELLRVVSSVARVRRSIAKPVEPTAVLWKDQNGVRRQLLFATRPMIVYSGVVQLSAPGALDHCLEVALKDDTVRRTLDDFLSDWDFPRLRRVGEVILLDLGAGDAKRGVCELVKRGWAPEASCDLFWESVNYGDRNSAGAHSHLRRVPGPNPMNRIECGEFLRGLLAKWVESKI